MKTQNLLKSILSVAVITVMLSAVPCDAANPSALAEHWISEDGGSVDMELFKDGTGMFNGIRISWKVENKRFILSSPPKMAAYDYKISSSKLTLTDNNGNSATYVKKVELEKTRKKEIEKNSSYFTDSRDGQKYRAIKIGSQTWMAENLNYNAEGSKCYGNALANCQTYGKLYEWKTAIKVCPSGWHLPSQKEWRILIDFAGGNKIAGKILKARNGWDNLPGDGTDTYGFEALPSGNGYSDGRFYSMGSGGYWWTKDKDEYGNLYVFKLTYDWNRDEDRISLHGPNLLSVRCIKDYAGPDTEGKEMEQKKKEEENKKARTEAPSETATSSSFADARDGNKYRSVKIGSKIWMAENLNYNAKGSLCYGNNPANCTKYGRLYDWETAKKACPNDWHLPDNEEWDALYHFADGTSGADNPYESKTAGKYLKAASGWNGGGNGTNAHGFAALPGGNYYNGSFTGADDYGYWWSASEGNSKVAHRRSILYSDDYGYWRSGSKSYFLSVRCVKD